MAKINKNVTKIKMIEIVPYGPKWEQAHIAFATKYWTKSRRKIPEYIYWKFRGEPSTEISSFILAVENDTVIGQLGLIPVNIQVEDGVYETQWACDLMVDIAYRGKGVAKLLYDFAHSQKIITVGCDPSPAASASMQKNGYDIMSAAWKCFLPMNLNEITKLKKRNYKIFKNIPNPFLLFFKILDKIQPSTFKTLRTDFFEKEYKPPSSNLYAFVVRNKSFIMWRYSHFSKFYDGFEIRINQREIWYSGFFSKNYYYITDFRITNDINFIGIVNDIINRYKKMNLSMIRFYSNDNRLVTKLPFFGCLKFKTKSEIIYFTTDVALKSKLITKDFFYTYADSDDNI